MRTSQDGITLRAVDPDHLDRMVAYLGDPALSGIRQIEGDRDRPMSVAELQKALESFATPQNGEVFGIWRGDELVGHTGADWWWDVHSPTLDLVIAPPHQRQGVGTTTFRLMARHLFEDTVARMINVWTPDWNEAGIGFIQHLEMTPIGRSRRTGVRAGRYVDTLVFHVSRQMWEEASWR